MSYIDQATFLRDVVSELHDFASWLDSATSGDLCAWSSPYALKYKTLKLAKQGLKERLKRVRSLTNMRLIGLVTQSTMHSFWNMPRDQYEALVRDPSQMLRHQAMATTSMGPYLLKDKEPGFTLAYLSSEH